MSVSHHIAENLMIKRKNKNIPHCLKQFQNRIGKSYKEAGARVAQWVRSLILTTHSSLSPIRRGFAPGFVNYKKGCTRLSAASDKVYQLLVHCRWFSPGTPASSTTKTGRHDIAEILLKVALNTKNQSTNRIKRQNRYPQHTYTCPLVYLVRYRHFIKRWRGELVLWA